MAWALRRNYEGYQAFEDQERENLEAHQRQVNHMYHQKELEAHNSRGSGSGCYMPVRELGSTSFSAIPVTSPSFPSCLRHSHHLSITTVSSSYVLFIIVYHRLFVFRLSSFSSLRIYSAPVMFQASFFSFVAALSYFNILTFLWLDNKFIVFVIL